MRVNRGRESEKLSAWKLDFERPQRDDGPERFDIRARTVKLSLARSWTWSGTCQRGSSPNCARIVESSCCAILSRGLQKLIGRSALRRWWFELGPGHCDNAIYVYAVVHSPAKPQFRSGNEGGSLFKGGTNNPWICRYLPYTAYCQRERVIRCNRKNSATRRNQTGKPGEIHRKGFRKNST